jgi:hypothetical protein
MSNSLNSMAEACRVARDKRRSGVRLRNVSPWTVVTSLYYQSWKRTFSAGTQQILVENGCWQLKTVFHDARGTHESVHWGRNEAVEAADHAGVRKSWEMPVNEPETVPQAIRLSDLQNERTEP